MESSRQSLNNGINETDRDRYLGEQVWNLHLALADEAQRNHDVYRASAEDAQEIRSLAEHREAELALELILANGSSKVSPILLEEARRVARLVCDDESGTEVHAWVEQWLAWHEGCGVDPPHWT